MNRIFKLEWNIDELAAVLRVQSRDVLEYFTDGRRVSFIIERRIVWDHPGWRLASSERAGYDLVDPEGGCWEVRSITRDGVYFNPSAQVGSGRRFEEAGFQVKLSRIRGFLLSDISLFPSMDVYVLPVENVLRWHAAGQLGTNAKVSRARFLRLVPDIRHDPAPG